MPVVKLRSTFVEVSPMYVQRFVVPPVGISFVSDTSTNCGLPSTQNLAAEGDARREHDRNKSLHFLLLRKAAPTERVR